MSIHRSKKTGLMVLEGSVRYLFETQKSGPLDVRGPEPPPHRRDGKNEAEKKTPICASPSLPRAGEGGIIWLTTNPTFPHVTTFRQRYRIRVGIRFRYCFGFCMRDSVWAHWGGAVGDS